MHTTSNCTKKTKERTPLGRTLSSMFLSCFFVVLVCSLFSAQSTFAASGDFSIDFIAAAPGSYNHLTGGGAYDDRTIGVNADTVESLEGGDFECGDIVTYFATVTVDDVQTADDDAPQTIQMDFSFLADTTGQSGVAIGQVVLVQVNYDPIEDLIAGENTVDDGINDDAGSTATILTYSDSGMCDLMFGNTTDQCLTGPLFQMGSELLLTVELTDLERAEQVVVRIDVKLFCDPGSNPTGNLQADLQAAVLTFINDTTPVNPPEALSGGAQTIPFKQIGNIGFPLLNIEKTVSEDGTCPGVEEVNVPFEDQTVKYCYVVTNADENGTPGTSDLFDIVVVDDNGTPGDTSDDFSVTLTSGLTDIDGDGDADDLAAGATATGEAIITFNPPRAPGKVTNTATVTGNDAIIQPTTLTDSDTACVVIQEPACTAPTIMVTKDAVPTTLIVPGGMVEYTITVTNTSTDPTSATTIIGINDDPYGDITDAANPAISGTNCAVGQNLAHAGSGSNSYTCSFTAIVTETLTDTVTALTQNECSTVPGQDDATVTVLNAKISIDPPDATNEVGDEHELTATVMEDLGDGGGFIAAVGETVTFSIDSGTATFVGGIDSCVTDASGQCSVSIVSNTTGDNTISATSNVDVNGFPVSVSTDGMGNNSGPANKTYADAKISIDPPDATNEVGDEHVVTATVMEDTGSGFVAAVGETVTFSIDSGDATFVGGIDSCVTDGSGQCSVSIVSNTTGDNTISATSDVNVDGITITRTTDGTGNNSGPANKTYADAKISIDPPDATNEVGDEHVVTATVMEDTGSGFVAAVGETVTFSIDSGDATFVGGIDSCVTDGSGQCSVSIVSNTTGDNTISATSDVNVDGITITRTTDGTGNNSGPANKTYADAKISIDPPDATNEVGDEHVVTATVMEDTGSGFVAAVGETVTFSIDSGDATFVGGIDSCVTDGSGQCSVSIVSNTTGDNTISATSDVNVDGITITRTTDGTGNNSGPANKTYADAKISIDPPDATNEVGDEHVVTATVMEDTGSGFVAAVGETVTFSIDSGDATFVGGIDSCVTDGSGQCSVSIVSNTTGDNTISATSDVNVDGITITRTTDGTGNNSGPANKTYADAKISIDPPDATNEVGDEHVVTATVMEDTGSGFVAAVGETVTFSIDSGDATFVGGIDSCVTDGSGQCSVSIVSNTTGDNTISATSDVDVNGITITRTTDGTGNNSGPANKTYADAKISIDPPDATNEVGDEHVVTATVMEDTGSGFVAAAGETVTFSIDSGDATFVGGIDSCVTDGSGQCSVSIVSNTTGDNTISATSDVNVDGITITRTTDGTGNNSGPANKTYADAKISIDPPDATNEVGDEHVVTATVMEDTGSGFVAAVGETVTFSIDSGDATFVGGIDSCVTDGSGQCSVSIVSNTTGDNTISATSDVDVNGITITRTTDGTGNNSGPANKTYADAKISIDPPDATNEVGDEHVVTATVMEDTGSGFVAAAGETVTFSIDSGDATFVGGIDSCVTDGSGQCSVSIVSNTTGDNTISATSDVDVNGITITRTTDGTGNNSGPANKTYADAKISIDPPDATNEVGDEHVVTATVMEDTGSGFVAAVGETVTFSIDSGDATFVGGIDSCVTDGSGQCSVSIVSNTTGDNTISATSDVDVNGITITRTTDGTGNNSGPANKTYADAKISIDPPDATNEVGDEHVVTATVMEDTGSGFVAAAGETVTFSIDSGDATFVGGIDSCVTDGSGQCSVSIVSNTTGDNTISATSDVNVDGITITRTTDGTGNNSGPANKTYADAKISIDPPDATNEVGDEHVVTATVMEDTGSGFVAAVGETVTFSIDSGDATFVGGIDSCVTDGSGQCSVSIVSNTTGDNTISATSDVDVNGITITRTTDGTGNNSGPANKTYADAKISIDPPDATNEVGDEHVVTATVMEDTGSGFVAAAGETVTFSIDSGDATFVGGIDSCVTDGSGQCSVSIVSNTTGDNTISATSDVDVNGITITRTTDGTGNNSGPANKTYADAKISIDPPDATNEVGDEHVVTATVMEDTGSGFVAAVGETVTFSIDSGDATFVGGIDSCVTDGSGQCSVSIVSNTTGDNTISATSDVNVDGITITRTTDGTGNNSGPANKTYADAKISIDPPDATNEVGDEHVVTATVMEDTGSGFVAAAGETVTFSIDSGDATFVGGIDSCVTDGSGQCSVSIVSNTTGDNTISATSDVDVNGITITRTTDGTGNNSGPANKTYADAKISIDPPDATNEVGDEHVVTATVMEDTGSGFVAAAGETVTFSIDSGDATFVGGIDSCVTDGSGQCSVSIVSNTTGDNTISATSDVDVNGITITRTTDGTGNNSGPANKTYADAKISIDPPDATNEVGDEHVVTATVMEDTGSGFVAAAGETVTFSIDSGDATFVGGIDSCVTDGSGQCSLSIVSNTTGDNTISATSDVDVNGITITRTTDGTGNNSGPANKTYVDAKIEIAPLVATNRAGDDHVLTATVMIDDGSGFVLAPDGTQIDFSLLNDTAATSFVGGIDSCTTTGGSCSVTISSNATGSVDIQASTTVNVGGLDLTRTTGTGAPNSDNANKLFVDAKISIDPQDGTNVIGDPHTLTATVMEDAGDGSGFVAAEGETVTFDVTTLFGAGFAEFVGGIDNCETDANGQCSVQIVSNDPGVYQITASSDVSVGGLDVSVTTDGSVTPSGGQNSGPARKVYVQPNQPSIEVNSLTLVCEDEVTISGEFNITDESVSGSLPDGFFVILKEYQVDFEHKTKGPWQPADPNGPEGGSFEQNGGPTITYTCEYDVVDIDGVPGAPAGYTSGDPIIFDEEVNISYTCTLSEQPLSGSLRGTADAGIFNRSGQRFQFRATKSLP